MERGSNAPGPKPRRDETVLQVYPLSTPTAPLKGCGVTLNGRTATMSSGEDVPLTAANIHIDDMYRYLDLCLEGIYLSPQDRHQPSVGFGATVCDLLPDPEENIFSPALNLTFELSPGELTKAEVAAQPRVFARWIPEEERCLFFSGGYITPGKPPVEGVVMPPDCYTQLMSTPLKGVMYHSTKRMKKVAGSNNEWRFDWDKWEATMEQVLDYFQGLAASRQQLQSSGQHQQQQQQQQVVVPPRAQSSGQQLEGEAAHSTGNAAASGPSRKRRQPPDSSDHHHQQQQQQQQQQGQEQQQRLGQRADTPPPPDTPAAPGTTTALLAPPTAANDPDNSQAAAAALKALHMAEIVPLLPGQGVGAAEDAAALEAAVFEAYGEVERAATALGLSFSTVDAVCKHVQVVTAEPAAARRFLRMEYSRLVRAAAAGEVGLVRGWMEDAAAAAGAQ